MKRATRFIQVLLIAAVALSLVVLGMIWGQDIRESEIQMERAKYRLELKSRCQYYAAITDNEAWNYIDCLKALEVYEGNVTEKETFYVQ